MHAMLLTEVCTPNPLLPSMLFLRVLFDRRAMFAHVEQYVPPVIAGSSVPLLEAIGVHPSPDRASRIVAHDPYGVPRVDRIDRVVVVSGATRRNATATVAGSTDFPSAEDSSRHVQAVLETVPTRHRLALRRPVAVPFLPLDGVQQRLVAQLMLLMLLRKLLTVQHLLLIEMKLTRQRHDACVVVSGVVVHRSAARLDNVGYRLCRKRQLVGLAQFASSADCKLLRKKPTVLLTSAQKFSTRRTCASEHNTELSTGVDSAGLELLPTTVQFSVFPMREKRVRTISLIKSNWRTYYLHVIKQIALVNRIRNSKFSIQTNTFRKLPTYLTNEQRFSIRERSHTQLHSSTSDDRMTESNHVRPNK